ncbi:hypothetical protein WA158_006125 [Blastocystis sp. Blastoise]
MLRFTQIINKSICYATKGVLNSRITSLSKNKISFLRTFAKLSKNPTSSEALSAVSADYMENLYKLWKENPSKVDQSWHTFFIEMEKKELLPGKRKEDLLGSFPSNTDKRLLRLTSDINKISQSETYGNKSLALFQLIQAYEIYGGTVSSIDPLNLHKPKIPAVLQPSTYGLDDTDLTRIIPLSRGNLDGIYRKCNTFTVERILDLLQKEYCNNINIEYFHLEDPAEKNCDLQKTSALESYIYNQFNGVNMYNIEGNESVIPGIAYLFNYLGQRGVTNIIVGMTHRGRLSFMSTIMGIPFQVIFNELYNRTRLGHATGTTIPENEWIPTEKRYYQEGITCKVDISGTDSRGESSKKLSVSLMPFPSSYNEIITSVIMGKTKAKQMYQHDYSKQHCIPVVVHGDSSFYGDGTLYETTGIQQNEEYSCGGVIHIIVNNQTYNTNSSSFAHPTNIFIHVNADDIEGVMTAMTVAAKYKLNFNKSIVVDIVGYNRKDNKQLYNYIYKNRSIYDTIENKERSLDIYGRQLLSEHVLSVKYIQDLYQQLLQNLNKAYLHRQEIMPMPHGEDEYSWSKLKNPTEMSPVQTTGMDIDQLVNIGRSLFTLPPSIYVSPKEDRLYKERIRLLTEDRQINWNTAEQLAISSLCLEGTHVLLNTQNINNITQRHMILYDTPSKSRYIPLLDLTHKFQNPRGNDSFFTIASSSISNASFLAYSLGYSYESPSSLTIWEPKSGDFVNNAQAIIDNYIAPGESRWRRQSGLIMLLPHGYQYNGYQSHSCKIERFLSMCNDDPDYIPPMDINTTRQIQTSNWQICCVTTPANYFHIIRRQIHRQFRKPLILAIPAGIMENSKILSSIDEISTSTKFQRLLPDNSRGLVSNNSIRKIIFCSGSIYYELLKARESLKINDVALIRLEQLSPFPFDLVAEQVQKYQNAKCIWCQEEPKNMGAYSYIKPRFSTTVSQLVQKEIPLYYVGRHTASSSESLYGYIYKEEQTEEDGCLSDKFKASIQAGLGTRVYLFTHPKTKMTFSLVPFRSVSVSTKNSDNTSNMLIYQYSETETCSEPSINSYTSIFTYYSDSIQYPTIQVEYKCCDIYSWSMRPLKGINKIISTEYNTDSIHINMCTYSLCEYIYDSNTPQKPFFIPKLPLQIPVKNEDRYLYMNKTKEMFYFGIHSYLLHAFPSSQLAPMTCESHVFDPSPIPFLTLIDSLDTYIVIHDYEGFRRNVELLEGLNNFDIDINVNVFETTIRVLGGLLAAHSLIINKDLHIYSSISVLQSTEVYYVRDRDNNYKYNNIYTKVYKAYKKNIKREIREAEARDKRSIKNTKIYADTFKVLSEPAKESPYVYKNHLLDLAVDLANRLMKAFESVTKIPYGTVNLRNGVIPGETTVVSLAGSGSLLLEFAELSVLTKDLKYYKAAKTALVQIITNSNDIGLYGKHLDNKNKRWTEITSSIGSNSDSFYEYLLKGYIYTNDPILWDSFIQSYSAIQTYSRDSSHWHGIVNMKMPRHITKYSHSLSAFFSQLQIMMGDLYSAKETIDLFMNVYLRNNNYLPEQFSFPEGIPYPKGNHYSLRPELIESVMYYVTASNDTLYQYIAPLYINTIESARVRCGYTTIHNVNDGQLENEMPSYVLAETIKYIYLLLDNDNPFITSRYIYTTEAHIIDLYQIDNPYFFKETDEQIYKELQFGSSDSRGNQCNSIFISDSFLKSYMNMNNNNLYNNNFPLYCPVYDIYSEYYFSQIKDKINTPFSTLFYDYIKNIYINENDTLLIEKLKHQLIPVNKPQNEYSRTLWISPEMIVSPLSLEYRKEFKPLKMLKNYNNETIYIYSNDHNHIYVHNQNKNQTFFFFSKKEPVRFMFQDPSHTYTQLSLIRNQIYDCSISSYTHTYACTIVYNPFYSTSIRASLVVFPIQLFPANSSSPANQTDPRLGKLCHPPDPRLIPNHIAVLVTNTCPLKETLLFVYRNRGKMLILIDPFCTDNMNYKTYEIISRTANIPVIFICDSQELVFYRSLQSDSEFTIESKRIQLDYNITLSSNNFIHIQNEQSNIII